MADKIFYKFKNINEYCFDSLKNKYFYFSRPKQLNDPEDCRIPFSCEANDRKILLWIEHAKKMYRIQKKGKYPYDTVDKMKKAVSSGIFNDVFQNSMENAINNFHLLSLTDSFSNLYMWNHKDYCNNFSGICIGYNAFQLQKPKFNTFFVECIDKKQETFPYIQNVDGKYFFIIKKIEYNNDRKHFYNPFEEVYGKNMLLDLDKESINKLNIEYNFFHKTPHWEKEHEYRGFYYNSNPLNSKIYYPDTTLESITFGINVKESDRKTIIDIIVHNYKNYKEIPFYIAKEDNGKLIRTKYYKE